MTRELKLALIFAFSLVLVVWVLITDHVQKSLPNEVLSPIAANDPGLKTVRNDTPNPFIPDTQLVETQPLPKVAPQLVPGGGQANGQAGLAGPMGGSDSAVIIHQTKPQDNAQASQTPTGPTPDAGGLKPATTPDKTYAVQSGDTLYSICKKQYGDSSLHTKLAEYNKLTNKPLKLDQKLTLPAKDVLLGKALPYVKPATVTPVPPTSPTSPTSPTAPSATPTKPLMNEILNGNLREAAVVTTSYKIASGDTLSAIARKLKVSLSKLYELNPSLKARADNLIVGETLDLKLPKQ